MVREARPVLPIFILSIFAYSTAWAFGQEGHETTGAIAAALISGTHAEKEIAKILKPGEDLAFAAHWADCAKGERYCNRPLTDEMKAYAEKNKNHHQYHFADIPFQLGKYDPNAVGASPEDIVHILSQAIAVLQGKTSAAHNPHAFTKREAFFLICHLTGDIHQLLHVGAAYIDADNQFIKPTSQQQVDHGDAAKTEGGNWLMLGSHNLHGNWDTLYVQRAMTREHATSPQTFASALVGKHLATPKDSGDPTTWAEKWATESVKLAKAELENIAIDDVIEVDDHTGQHSQWDITLPASYPTRAVVKDEHQLWLAGARLAEIFKTIWP
jgi:hypothetical protein